MLPYASGVEALTISTKLDSFLHAAAWFGKPTQNKMREGEC
jgi:hypothetical protein